MKKIIFLLVLTFVMILTNFSISFADSSNVDDDGCDRHGEHEEIVIK